jgi:thiamine pyrophosphokinase
MPAEGWRCKIKPSLRRQSSRRLFLLRAVIVAAGSIDNPQRDRNRIQAEDFIIAADGGAAYSRLLGIQPDVIIGDLDSLDQDLLQHYRQLDINIITHPTHKDATDLELAIKYALQHEADEIIVLGALGERWDHSLGNILLLANPEFQEVTIRMVSGPVEIGLIQAPQSYQLTGTRGDLVSLIPIHGDASGITTHGLEYSLQDGRLKFGATRGISNTLTAESASISVQQGMLLCLHTRMDE